MALTERTLAPERNALATHELTTAHETQFTQHINLPTVVEATSQSQRTLKSNSTWKPGTVQNVGGVLPVYKPNRQDWSDLGTLAVEVFYPIAALPVGVMAGFAWAQTGFAVSALAGPIGAILGIVVIGGVAYLTYSNTKFARGVRRFFGGGREEAYA